jgi:hypothetical protein
MRLAAEGLPNRAIAAITGIPKNTIKHWKGTIRDWRRNKRKGYATGGQSDCPICDGRAIPEERYAYLLGLYLGDGSIASHARGVFRLRIVLDQKYPDIIEEAGAALKCVRGGGAVGFTQCEGCIEVGGYWKHWPCLFPQHGRGKKHLRKIELAPWQAQIVEKHPESLLRGLIQSDGCRSMNTINPRGKSYSYPRYQFSNRSDDIRKIFTDACDRLGIAWKQMNRWNISVARRQEVEKLDRFIGPKR